MDKIINKQAVNGSTVSEETTLSEAGFYWLQQGAVKVLVSNALESAGFVNGFSTRLGGVSSIPENALNLAGFDEDSEENIFENRRRFLDAFGGEMRLTSVWQVHGDSVRHVKDEREALETEEKHDAIISSLSGWLVAVKTADCVPVLVGDPVTGAFSAIHAGWRGTLSSIVRKSVEGLSREYGAKPENMVAAIGPAAGKDNYEVGAEVISAFSETFPDGAELFVETTAGHALIDLHRANKNQLIDSGLPASNISTAPLCTMERTDLFFSYRVEKRKYGKTGRLMSVIGRAS
ncbi:MAG: peptidoglycan editing factor PgeF [Pyrinomonadaceae bacterium]